MQSDTTEKYTKTGRIGNFLVNRFFYTIEMLLQPYMSTIDNALEVGAGPGFSTQRLRTMLNQDINFEASEYLSDFVIMAKARNPNTSIKQESIYELQHPDKSVDLVFCLEVLEHLEYPQSALQELARITRKFTLISTPREPLWRILNMMRGKYLTDFGNTPGHIQHWSTNGLQREVAHFFKIEAIRKPLPWSILLLRHR